MHWLALLALPTVFAQGTGTDVPWEETPGTATEGTTAPAGPTATGSPAQLAVAKVNEAAGLLSNASIENARGALTLLGEASQLDPEQAWAWYNKGVAHKILEEDSRARQSWLRATDIDPSLGDAWLQMGLHGVWQWHSWVSGELLVFLRSVQPYMAARHHPQYVILIQRYIPLHVAWAVLQNILDIAL